MACGNSRFNFPLLSVPSRLRWSSDPFFSCSSKYGLNQGLGVVWWIIGCAEHGFLWQLELFIWP